MSGEGYRLCDCGQLGSLGLGLESVETGAHVAEGDAHWHLLVLLAGGRRAWLHFGLRLWRAVRRSRLEAPVRPAAASVRPREGCGQQQRRPDPQQQSGPSPSQSGPETHHRHRWTARTRGPAPAAQSCHHSAPLLQMMDEDAYDSEAKPKVARGRGSGSGQSNLRPRTTFSNTALVGAWVAAGLRRGPARTVLLGPEARPCVAFHQLTCSVCSPGHCSAARAHTRSMQPVCTTGVHMRPVCTAGCRR